MSNSEYREAQPGEVCSCPPGSYGLGCDIHWEIVAAALVREVEQMPTGTTTRKAVARYAE